MKRTLAYTRVRRRSQRPHKIGASSAQHVHHEIVIFDPRPAEFPRATLLPRDTRSWAGVAIGDLGKWLLARWSWLKPRTVPVIVAAMGATLVIVSADYLSHAHGSVHHTVPAFEVSSTLSAP